MGKLPRFWRVLFVHMRVLAAAALTMGAFALHAANGQTAQVSAEPAYKLAPHTRIRLRVVEWVVARGEYRQWEAIEGEFSVSPAGTLLLPLVGTIDAANFDAATLANEIGQRLKAKTGLVEPPDSTVEIIQYPPIFLVGNVETPGEYQFRPGMTALQALALAGGRYRPREEVRTQDEIRHIGELETIRREQLRMLARISRLHAEISGIAEIHFPAELTTGLEGDSAASIITEERAIFATRAEALNRELETLSELGELYTGEIGVLTEKAAGQDQQIQRVEEELTAVRRLVEKGIATTARQSELERELGRLMSDKLDQITATMRARQNLSETHRDAQNLRGRQRIEVARELQEAQASLEQLRVRQEYTQRLLLAAGASVARTTQFQQMQDADLIYTIVRREGGNLVDLVAAETSLLQPGDTLKLALNADFRGLEAEAAAPVGAVPSADAALQPDIGAKQTHEAFLPPAPAATRAP